MWCIVVFSIGFFIWTAYFAPDFNANDPMPSDPEHGESYRSGTGIGKYLPSIICLMMGLFVLLERRRAIRFNWAVAVAWIFMIMFATLRSGLIGLTVGVLIPIFIPYWIGLFQIQKKWENEGVIGKGLF
jgi:hypothetical protein